MKTYNKSEIMKRAWEIKKSTGTNMHVGLIKAWEEAKSNRFQFEGTEKQIAFAKALIEKVEKQRGTKKESKYAIEFEIINNIPSNAKAGNVIDVLNANSNFMYNFRMVEKFGQPIEKAIEHINS